MAYTIKQFNNELKRQFGDRFFARGEVSSTDGFITIFLDDRQGVNPSPVINLKCLGRTIQIAEQSGIFNGLTNALLTPSSQDDASSTSSASDDKCIFSMNIKLSRFKKVANAVMDDLVEKYNAENQQLLIARNEIAYELEVRKASYAASNKPDDEKVAFEKACDASLAEVDKGLRGEPFDSNKLAEKVRRLQELDGTAKVAAAALLTLGVLLMIAGMALCWIGVGLPVAGLGTAAIFSGGTLLGSGVMGSFLGVELFAEKSLTSTKFSKVGRLANHFSSLFAKSQPAKESVTLASALQPTN